MQRTVLGLAMVFFVSSGVFLVVNRAEQPNADASAAPTVSAPERWLDLGMAAPDPAAVSPTGRRVVVETGCQAILYDVETDAKLHSWDGRFSTVRFSGDGRLLVAVQAADVVVCSAETGAEVRRFTGRPPAWNEPNYRSFTTIAALSDDGRLAAIANRRGSYHRDLPASILVYDTDSGELRGTLATAEKTEITSVAFVPNGTRLLAGYSSQRENEAGRFFYALWDTEPEKLICEFPLNAVARTSPDGRRIAAGMLVGNPFQWTFGTPRPDSTKLTVWDTASGKPVRTFEHTCPSRDFTFSRDGERILAALQVRRDHGHHPPYEGRLIEWDVRSGETRFEGDDSKDAYASVAYSPDGRRRFATTERPNGLDDDVDHHLCGWSVATDARLPIGDYRFASYNGREDLFFYRKGDRYIDRASAFAVRDVLSGETVKTLPEYRLTTTQVAFTPDGETVLVGNCLLNCRSGTSQQLGMRGRRSVFLVGGRVLFTYDGARLYLSNALSSEVFWQFALDAHYQRFDAAISLDARHIVVSQRSDPDVPSAPRVILIDTAEPDKPRILERYAPVVAFCPDGGRFLAASPEAIDEIDAETGDRVRTLWTPPGRPLAAAYSSDGSKIVACGVVGHAELREPVTRDDAGWAMLWDARTNEAISLKGHTAPVTTAAFGPDGTRCVTGSLDKTIRLWDTSAGRSLHVFRGNAGGIHDLAYSPRGDRILAAAGDGVAFWSVAEFADPPVEMTPLAESFSPCGSFGSMTSAFGPRSGPSGDTVPAWLGNLLPLMRAPHQEAWTVVEVGNIDRGRLSADMQRWLSRAKSTEHCDAPPSREPAEPSPRFNHRDTSRDGRRVYTSSREKKVVLCDREGKILRTWDGPPRYSGHMGILPSGKEVIISREVRSGDDSHWKVIVYDAESGRQKRVIGEADDRFLGIAAIDPKERTIILRTSRYAIDLRDYQTGKRLGALAGNQGGAARKIDYSPNGRLIATSKFPGLDVALYDPTTLAPAKTLENLLPVRWFAFSPDGKRLMVGQLFGRSTSDLLTLWDVDSGRRLWSRCGPISYQATFSSDGRRPVGYGRGNSLQVSAFWDVEAGEMLCVVLASDSVPSNKPVLGDDGDSLHLGTPDGPEIWPWD